MNRIIFVIIYATILLIMTGCEDGILVKGKIRIIKRDYAYYLREDDNNVEKYFGGAILIFSTKTNQIGKDNIRKEDIIYYISDDHFYGYSTESDKFIGITNIYLSYRYCKILTEKQEKKNGLSK